uniref:Uncharacterized protein n=1 Tax=Rhizophora mucronata TaxID=61149 RepID=A0A2P2J0H9_RHIMU
MDTLSRCSVKR